MGEQQRKSAAGVLQSKESPLNKVRKLVSLGYDEMEADAMVSNLQVGTNQMMYYEQLPDPDYQADSR